MNDVIGGNVIGRASTLSILRVWGMADIGGVSSVSCFVCRQLDQLASNSVGSEGKVCTVFMLHEDGVRGSDGGV